VTGIVIDASAAAGALLAAIRERRTVMNQFYVSRGLTPDPDPYPELP